MNRIAAACAAFLIIVPALGSAQLRAPVATMLAQEAKGPQSVVLAMTLTKGTGPEMKPSLVVPPGGEASAEPAPGITVNVSRVEVAGKQVSLRIGVSEASAQGLVESLITVDLPLDKPAKLQLGSDPARAWVLEFTPRVTPADAKPAS